MDKIEKYFQILMYLIQLCIIGLFIYAWQTKNIGEKKSEQIATENYRDEFLSSVSGIENNNIIWLKWPTEPCWINIPCPKYDISVSPQKPKMNALP